MSNVPKLTFLNTTDAPGLSKKDAKTVRGHVTRKVFAAKRLEKKLLPEDGGEGSKRKKGPSKRAPKPMAIPLRPRAPPCQALTLTPAEQQRRLLKIIWHTNTTSATRFEAQGLSVLASEPAIPELLLSMAAKYYSNSSAQYLSLRSYDYHSQKAISMAIRRISENSPSINLLKLTILMALAERLAGNHRMWETHMRGAAGILSNMKTGPEEETEENLGHFISDSINAIFGLPRVWHSSIIHELSTRDRVFNTLSHIIEDYQNLRRSSSAENSDHQEIEQLEGKLWVLSKALRWYPSPYIRTVAAAIEVMLCVHMSQYHQNEDLKNQSLRDLMETMAGIRGRTCSLLDLSNCMYWLGAIVADPGSEEGEWFLGKLILAFMSIDMRQMEGLRAGLERAYTMDGEWWAERFRAVWDQVSACVSRLGEVVEIEELCYSQESSVPL